jgi:hypothetical protein
MWLAPASGVAAAGFTLASVAAAGSTPQPSASDADVVAFYAAHANAQLVSGASQSLAALAFLLFAAILYRHLRDGSGARAAPVFCFAGAIVFATGLALLAGISVTLGDSIHDLTSAAAQAINALALVAVFVVTVGISAFMLGAGAAAVRGRALPSWLAWCAIAIGAIAAVPSHVLGGLLDHIGYVAFIGVFVWIGVAGFAMARRPS